jgi:hypothetical protein
MAKAFASAEAVLTYYYFFAVYNIVKLVNSVDKSLGALISLAAVLGS